MTRREQVDAIIRALRLAYQGPHQYGGVVHFEVRDIFKFAEALARVGVYVDESREGES